MQVYSVGCKSSKKSMQLAAERLAKQNILRIYLMESVVFPFPERVTPYYYHRSYW